MEPPSAGLRRSLLDADAEVERGEAANTVGALPRLAARGAERSSGVRARQTSVYSATESETTHHRAKALRSWGEQVADAEALDYETIDNSWLRSHGRHRARVARGAITVIIGLLVGVVAFGVEYSVKRIGGWRLKLLDWVLRGGAGPTGIRLAGGIFVHATTAVSLSLAAAALVRSFPAASGAGVALVMANLNGLHVPRLLSTGTLLAKCLGTVCSVSSGLFVGPEGPLVHIGAGIASFFTRQHKIRIWGKTFHSHNALLDLFHNDSDRREFLSAGVAGGLAAAFGAPIGGVLFSLEEASTFWSEGTTWRALLCTTIATFILALAHGSHGKLSAPGLIQFGDNLDPTYKMVELPLFALLAALTGVVGAVFTRCASWLSTKRPTTTAAKFAEVFAVTALVTVACCLLPLAAGTCKPIPHGVEGWNEVSVRFICAEGEYNDLAILLLGDRDAVIPRIMELRAGHMHFGVGALACATATLLVLMLLGCDLAVPAGLFMPTILWGAMLGSIVGVTSRDLIHALLGVSQAANVQPGTYALVGATAALAGVFRSSISLVVIMLEGTGNVSFLLPLLLGVAVANLTGARLSQSFYEEQLENRGLPFLHRHCPAGLHGKVSRDIMARDVKTFRTMENVGVIVDTLSTTTHNGFPVVGCAPSCDSLSSSHFKGTVLRSQLLVLLSRRAFLEVLPDLCEASVEDCGRLLLGPGPWEDLDSDSDTDGEEAAVEPLARPDPVGGTKLTLQSYLQSLDTAMRTYHHRHTFHDRTLAVGHERTLGLTEEERAMHVDLTQYMNIAPLVVQDDCSTERAFSYFMHQGLRHLPVVDTAHRVVGMLTRKDFLRGGH